jgi:hypothetical membrane protein
MSSSSAISKRVQILKKGSSLTEIVISFLINKDSYSWTDNIISDIYYEKTSYQNIYEL